MLHPFVGRLAALGLALLAGLPARAQNTDERWSPVTRQYNTVEMTYRAVAPLMDRKVPIALRFWCNSTRKGGVGGLGLEIVVGDYEALAPFDFLAFEGPDAPAGGQKLVHVAMRRSGKPPVAVTTAVNGWISPDPPGFAFGVPGLVTERTSPGKSILSTLADGADALEVAITDFRDRTRTLQLGVPVAGHRAEFQALRCW